MSVVDTAGEYVGEMQNGRYHGRGMYTYGDGCYEGTFYDGMYHGEGKLTVKGGSFQGYWSQGKLVDGGFVFDDGLPHLKLGFKFWEYCSQYDPRFYSEIKGGIRNGEALQETTSHEYAHLLPVGMFDVIDGYYDPKKHAVFDYVNNELVRMPNQEEADWILANCRIGE